MQIPFIKKGLIEFLTNKNSDSVSTGFDLNRWVKKRLNALNIPFYDKCCDDALLRPTRFNVTDGVSESFNGTTWVPITVNSLSTLSVDTITEKTALAGVTISKAVIQKRVASAINATATATAAQIKTGLVTSTSAAATTITLPTATALATSLGAVRGTSFDFIVDNTAGANTVTVAVGSGIVVAKQTSTGNTADDQLLTVAASATVGVGVFRIVFTSATAAVLFRL